MYSFEQDHTAAARTTTTFDTSYDLQPCAAGRSLQLSVHHHPGGQQVLRNAAGSTAAAAAVQPRRAAKSSSKKHAAASRHSSSSRRSTTVVATDVNNFRAMVQELTGFPPAAIFRPLPRRVHAASPFVAGVAAAAGQGCGGREQHGHASWEATNSSSTTAGGGNSSSPDDAPAMAPSEVLVAQQPQFAPLGVFDGLSDLGSPEFDSWGDLSID